MSFDEDFNETIYTCRVCGKFSSDDIESVTAHEETCSDDVYCSLCGNPVYSFGPEDACGNNKDGWTHLDCARNQ